MVWSSRSLFRCLACIALGCTATAAWHAESKPRIALVSFCYQGYTLSDDKLRGVGAAAAGALPVAILFVDQPLSTYQRHKKGIWSVLAFLIAQSLVITVLALEVKRRKHAEKELALSAEQYRAIFEQSPMGMVEVGMDGCWRMMNDRACEITGYSRAERFGKRVKDIISAEDWKRVKEAYTRLVNGESDTWSAEGEALHKSGKKIWLQWMFSLIRDDQDQPKVFILMLDDVTRRKEAEFQLLRSNTALSHFAHAAAHDLQEPLRNVALSSDVLMREYHAQLDEFAQRLLRENVAGSLRMLGMVKALLEYSEAVANADQEPPTTVETQDALGRALLNLQSAINEGGVEIVHSALPAVQARETHVVQLFQNLIGNAVKYRKKDQPGHVSVSAKPNGAEWIFEVADDGIGFEPAYAERIFGVFKRLHSRKDYPGTGIGLAICARIVEHYGGRIWAESEPSAGSRFFFSLPGAGSGNGNEPKPTHSRAKAAESAL